MISSLVNGTNAETHFIAKVQVTTRILIKRPKNKEFKKVEHLP